MAVSFAAVSTPNMELTPVRVTYKGVDLGGTLSGAVIAPKFSKADIKADQLGSGTTLDRRVNGLSITVTTELSEVQKKENWKVVFPHAKLVDGGIAGKSVYFQSAVGDGDLSNSGLLVLHPLSLPDADKSGDLNFYKAVASAESEITYGPDNQATLKIVWNVLPDTSVQPAKFMLYGDPAIALTAAIAAAAVPGGGNVGNGTVTGVTAYSGVTKTETITMTAVTAVLNGGVFAVSGSLSGALGLATVGLSFTPTGGDPGVISFTINDGATDFAVGDSFTIATTASNYV